VTMPSQNFEGDEYTDLLRQYRPDNNESDPHTWGVYNAMALVVRDARTYRTRMQVAEEETNQLRSELTEVQESVVRLVRGLVKDLRIILEVDDVV
jgi:uncharacterized UPF0160 family protein